MPHYPRTEAQANRIAAQRLRELEKLYGSNAKPSAAVTSSRSISFDEAKLRTEALISEVQ